jgi:rubrerythrin
MASRKPTDGARPQLASRRRVLGRALAGGLTLVVGGYALEETAAGAAPSKANDARIFTLALQIEYTEEAFYREALRHGALKGELREYAQAAHDQDAQHLALLKAALGSAAPARPRFAFGAATRSPAAFVATASKLEDIAVAGYNGQAANLTKKALAVAATIVSVEARHAAWVRALAGQVAAPDAVDRPMTAAQVLAGLHEVGLRR